MGWCWHCLLRCFSLCCVPQPRPFTLTTLRTVLILLPSHLVTGLHHTAWPAVTATTNHLDTSLTAPAPIWDSVPYHLCTSHLPFFLSLKKIKGSINNSPASVCVLPAAAVSRYTDGDPDPTLTMDPILKPTFTSRKSLRNWYEGSDQPQRNC